MIIRLRNPTREVEMAGPMSVARLMNQLQLNRESILLVRNGTLVPGDAQLSDDDVVEVRPVISGGHH
jgi:sulfur carrier protein